MRKADTQQDTLFSTVIPEERVPKGRPLRPIRKRVNAALKQMQGQIKLLSGQGNWSVDIVFNELYSDWGMAGLQHIPLAADDETSSTVEEVERSIVDSPFRRITRNF